MQDGMVGTVLRLDERKDRYDAHVVVGEGSGPGTRCQRAIDSTRVLERGHSGVSGEQNAAI